MALARHARQDIPGVGGRVLTRFCVQHRSQRLSPLSRPIEGDPQRRQRVGLFHRFACNDGVIPFEPLRSGVISHAGSATWGACSTRARSRWQRRANGDWLNALDSRRRRRAWSSPSLC